MRCATVKADMRNATTDRSMVQMRGAELSPKGIFVNLIELSLKTEDEVRPSRWVERE